MRTYLRPVGRLTPPPATGSAGRDGLVRVAGRDDLVFASLERIDRQPGGHIERRLVSLPEVEAAIASGGPGATDLAHCLGALTRPRLPIAGLAFDRLRLMGIVNVTPDSFSDGGSFGSARAAIDHAMRLADEGADFLDIGGESTRPGSEPVPLEEEVRRVLPVVEGLAGRTSALISVDTRKAAVMRRAAAAGAHLVNDVSALAYDPESLGAIAETRLPVVLMHAQGDPKTMQQDPRYDDVLLDVLDALAGRIAACRDAGIDTARIVVDPGIGFGKTVRHNLELLAGLALMHGLGVPVMVGASRKSTIGRLTGATDPARRVPGSVAAALSGAMQGAAILRVHDVAETRQALLVWEAATLGRPAPGSPGV